jgi:hypothetical protein
MFATDTIVQGNIIKSPPITPTVTDEVTVKQEYKVASIPYAEVKKPRPVQKPILTRFSTGKTLRAQGKERIYQILRPFESTTPYLASPGTKAVEEIIQQPTVFPELAGFDKLDVGLHGLSQEPAVQQGIWGNLSNIITKAGEIYTTVTTQKAQTEIAKSQVAIEEAKARAAATQAWYSSLMPSAGGGITSYLPIIALAGGGILLVTMLGKKKRR